PGASSRSWSSGEGPPRLEQRLQAREHEHPALAGDALGSLRRALEPVVHEREQARSVLARVDLPGDAARLLRRELRVVVRDPLVHEPPRRIFLEDGLLPAHAALRPRIAAPVPELQTHAVEVLLR